MNSTILELKSETIKANASLPIGQKVRKFVMEEYNQLIFGLLIALLIVLIIILYQKTFKQINKVTLQGVNYYKRLELAPLPACSEIPVNYQHRLCDYYIAASYNTPAIGNQHFDYVSIDMIVKVLNSGARYIQLPICGYSVDQDTMPVVGTAEDGKSLITSLNTLNLREVLANIRDNAFRYLDKESTEDNQLMNKMNYPLIIHLNLHTINPDVVDKAADDIKDILGKYLLNPDKYRKYPIQFEKVCKLLNKIIIFCNTGYEMTRMANIVTPLPREFFRVVQKNDLITSDIKQEEFDKYIKELSLTQQKSTYRRLDGLANKLVQQMETGKGINDFLSDASMSDRTTIFNMFGITMVRPMETQTVESTNYNPFIPFTYGCQLIPLNYQITDDYMDTYINIFKKSSFVLKPSGLRLPISEEKIIDLLDNYRLDKQQIKLNIIPDFVSTVSDRFIQLNEISSGLDRILTYSGSGDLIFKPRSPVQMDNIFLIKRSKLSNKNDLVHLVSSQDFNVALTVDKSGNIRMDQLGSNLASQSFHPEIGMESEQGVPRISFRLFDSSPPSYIGVFKTGVKLYTNTEDAKMITMEYATINTREIAKIEHIGGFAKMYDDIAGISKNVKLANASEFEIIIAKNDTSVSDAYRTVYIKSVTTGKFMTNKLGLFAAGDKIPVQVFLLGTDETGNTTIMDKLGNYLTGSFDGTLRFKKENQVIAPVRKDKNGKVITEARIGPSLGSAKYFKLHRKITLA